MPVIRAVADSLATSAKEATGAPIGDGCIWRALKDPLVRCTEERWVFLRSNPTLYVNEDMPGLIVDAAKQYHVMRINAEHHFEAKRQHEAKEEAKRQAAQARGNGIVRFGRK